MTPTKALSLAAALALSSVGSAAVKEPDHIFELPSVAEIFRHEGLTESLDQFLRKCDREGGLADPSGMASPCTKAKYVSELRELERELQNPDRVLTANVHGDGAAGEMPRRTDHDLSYGGEYFIDYEVTRRPLVVEQLPSLLEDANAAEALSSCLEYERSDMDGTKEKKEGESPNFISLSGGTFCPESRISVNLKVPKYVMNDYLQRADTTRPHTYVEDSVQAIYLRPSDVIPPTIASCPASLNGLFVVLSPSEEKHSSRPLSKPVLRSRAFNPASASTILKPSIRVDDSLYARSYAVDTWDESIVEGGFEEGMLGVNDAVYIPPDFAVSFRREDGIETARGIILVRFCTLDASNFNQFKRSLRIEAFIDHASMELLTKLNDPNFDLKMRREVPSISSFAHGYKVWPWSELKQGSETNADNNRRMKRKGRRRRGAFSDWQTSRSWDHRVLGLTLPTLNAPQVTGSGRREVTLTWYSPFSKEYGDPSTLGYNITWDEFTESGVLSSQGAHTFEEGADSEQNNFKVEYIASTKSQESHVPVRKLTGTIDGLKPGHAYKFRVALMYVGRSLFSPSSAPILTGPPAKPSLLASSPLILESKYWDSTLGTITGDKQQYTPSHGSDATMIVLEMRAPADDGGLDLLGYDVMMSHSDSSGHNNLRDWTTLPHGLVETVTDEKRAGGIVRLAIHDLLPGGSYEFKVAPRNRLGRGPWSASSTRGSTVFSPARGKKEAHLLHNSGRVSTPKPVPILHGIGGRKMSSPDGYEARGPVLIVDDSKQTVTKDGSEGHIDVWSSYWSPRGFMVKAEACGMVVGSYGEVLNPKDLERRLAVVDRGGGVPLAHKALRAQRAGAIGVIIVDSGSCVDFDQHCIKGSSKADGDYWGEFDDARAWKDLLIPVVLAKSGGEMEAMRRAVFWSKGDCALDCKAE